MATMTLEELKADMGLDKSKTDMLIEFHKSFSHPYGSVDITDKDAMRLRMRLIKEEFEEVIEAIELKESREDILKELCDLVYVVIGTAVALGMDFDKAFSLVHKSNMSKLGPDGKPVYREDGKIIKSENYEPPNLKECI